MVIEPAIDTCSREAAILQGAHACQTTSPFIQQKTVKLKVCRIKVSMEVSL